MAFNDDFKRVRLQLESDIGKVVAQTAFAVLSAVTQATPVGDPRLWLDPNSAPEGYVGGRARGNWQLGIGTEKIGETGAIDGSGVSTITRGGATLIGYKLGQKIIVNNNVPYIVELNNGHSTQAPIGFVEKAVQAAVNFIESATFL